MRLHIKTSGTKEVIPFNYQPILTGAIHKWLGWNKEHGKVSLYSFSWLRNGEANKKGIKFINGAYFFLGSTDQNLLKEIYKGIMKDPEIGFGLRVIEITIQEDPVFESNTVFHVASPVLVKGKIGDRIKHYSFNEIESDEILTTTMKTKLKIAGIDEEGINIRFERDYLKPRVKVIHYKGIGNKVNICPVRITGTPEQIAFAWNVGIGHSTGIGFGALK